MPQIQKKWVQTIFLCVTVVAGCQSNKKKQESERAHPLFEWVMLTSGVEASLRGLAAVDEKTVWASGNKGIILRTIDGGNNWTKTLIPGTEDLDFRDIHAFDENTALVLSAGLPAKIFKTTDGGQHWLETYKNEKEGVFFDAMDFWDRQNGIAFSDPINGRLLVITTKDEGETWQQVQEENIPETKEGEAGFAASGSCLRVYGDKNVWIGTGGGAARVFRSTDRGESWEVAPTPVIQGRPSTGIFSLIFKDALHGIAVGGDYQIDSLSLANAAFTTDGGKTWALIEDHPYGYKSCVSFSKNPNRPMLIAVGTSGSDYSIDNGASWHLIDTTAFHVVSFSENGMAGFAAGPKGKIARLKVSN